jgi:hypothetical protein
MKMWERHNHPSQLGGIEANDLGPCDRKDCDI